MDFQGSYSYSYKTNPFGFIEFLLELKREEGVRGEKRTRKETFFETDEIEKKNNFVIRHYNIYSVTVCG